MSVPALFLVRHGESEWNRAGRIQGTLDSPLTARGRDQARAIGDHLARVLDTAEFDVRVSPLGRALETARIIGERLDLDADAIVPDERITDFRLGILAGFPGWDEVARQHPELARLRLEDPLRFHPPDGESGADVVRRVESFLAACEARPRATLVVGHGVINKFVRAVRRGITGAAIIAQGEAQDVVYRLDGERETELAARAGSDS